MVSEKSFLQQSLSAFSIYCTAFLCGLATTWLRPATRLIAESEFDHQITDDIISNLENLMICGRLTCSVVCFLFINNVARRSFIVASVVVHAVTWCLLTIIFDIRQVLMYQFMFGIAIAFHDIISFIYLAEISSPRYRPFAIICDLFFYALGVESHVLADLLGNFSLLCTAALTLVIITISALYHTLESPYYLMMREKETEAMLNLSILNANGTADQVMNLFKDLEKYVDEEKSGSVNFYKSLTAKENLKIFLFVTVVSAIAYINFSEVFIPGHEYNNVNFSPIWSLTSISLVGIVLSTLPILVFKRYILLLGSFGFVAFLQLLNAALSYVEDTEYDNLLLPNYNRVRMVIPTLLYIIYVSVIYPLVYILRGEMFPYSLKVRGNALIEIFHIGMPLALQFALSPATTYLGTGLIYVLHAILSWLMVMCVIVYYRETKNLSLLQIRELYRM